MWSHYQIEQASGGDPTDAELDRVADTSNYGRGVLRRWRTEGRIVQEDSAGRRASLIATRSLRFAMLLLCVGLLDRIEFCDHRANFFIS